MMIDEGGQEFRTTGGLLWMTGGGGVDDNVVRWQWCGLMKWEGSVEMANGRWQK